MKVALIHRPKLNGFGKHYGVRVEYITGMFVDEYDKTAAGEFRKLTPEQFAERRPVTVESELEDDALIQAALARLDKARAGQVPFDIIGSNCEHFARYVVLGESKSKQVEGVGVIAGLLVVGSLLRAG